MKGQCSVLLIPYLGRLWVSFLQAQNGLMAISFDHRLGASFADLSGRQSGKKLRICYRKGLYGQRLLIPYPRPNNQGFVMALSSGFATQAVQTARTV